MKRMMCAEFDDIRLFGAVLTAGTNAGQIRGPMQLTFARSLKPIIPIESSITRVAITKASDFLRKQTEMGRKPWVSWAAYEQHGFYNAPLGAAPDEGGTGITREDLAGFWEAVANMFPEAKSAANGRMNVCELFVFVHDNARGCAPFHKLREKMILKEREGLTETTKGFVETYGKISINDQDKLATVGITIHRPLEDLWPQL
jgi:CRISPR-associated protein Csd2